MNDIRVWLAIGATMAAVIGFGLTTRATADSAAKEAKEAKIRAEQNTAQVNELRAIHKAIADYEEGEREGERKALKRLCDDGSEKACAALQ